MNWVHIAIQLDSKHWPVIFIHENGVVPTVMDTNDFIDPGSGQERGGCDFRVNHLTLAMGNSFAYLW
jgi:hypothetical protein